MPGYLRQSTATQLRALGPFIDDTDFKTPKTSLTINNTDIKLVKNGATAVNKNIGGASALVNGVYTTTFDATDTATVGEMEVSVVVATALPVFDKFFVVTAAIYDMLFGSSAQGYITDQPVNTTKIGGTTQTARDIGASVLLSVGTGTGQVNLSSGAIPITSNIKKNQAFNNFSFMMTAVGTHNPLPGLSSITVTRAIDGGSFTGGTLSAVTEESTAVGIYRVNFGPGDLNGNMIEFRATATGAEDTVIAIITTP
jgi:hypothetical protein